METDSTIELARIGEIPIEVFKIGLENDLDPLLLPLHAPQCACSMKRKNLLRRTCTSLFSKKLMSDSCANAQKWCLKAEVSENAEVLYLEILRITNETEYEDQIDKDITRSFQEMFYFTLGPGKIILKRLLKSFCKYMPHIGYVQGMNYLAGTLLWHSSEAEAFWLLVNLIQTYNLYEIYLPNFPGLMKHCHIIDFLTIQHFPNLYEHFFKWGIATQMYATDWCFTIFTSLVPLNSSQFVLENFFESGWMYFYKLVLEILCRLEEQILESNNIAEILTKLKPYSIGQRNWKTFVKNLEKNHERLTWKKLSKLAKNREIDELIISNLSLNAETN